MTWVSDVALFAQTVGQDVAPWVQTVGGLAGTGFAGWLAYHMVTALIPRLTDSFAKELAAAREHHDRLTREEREKCDARHADLLKRWEDSHSLLREVTHYVRDDAQRRAGERAAAELRRRRGEGEADE